MLRETQTKNGQVAGIPAADPRITVYKGIPFAKPPVGEWRWRPPQPADDWAGVLKADTFAPISMQETPGAGDPEALYNKEWHVDSDVPMSEDCLYLNVWTPAKSTDENLPVMVWLFGGGMCCGYTSEMEFDGERIARRGVVFVSVNYRLNAFGFLAHKELSEEESTNASGNYGLLDQLAGLKWVKDNISNFGGNPDNVTLFGQSAGGRSVTSHLVSPLSKDYFHKAIAQSGGGILLGWRDRYPVLEEAEAIGDLFLKKLGVQTITEARQLDAKTVLKQALDFISYYRWGPIRDGHFLSEDPVDAIRHGLQHDMPVMAGSTTNEMVFQPQAADFKTYRDSLKPLAGDHTDAYLKACGVNQQSSIEEIYKKATFNLSDLGNRVWAQWVADHYNSPFYLYRFGPDMPGDDAGAFHSSELWFVFETLAKCWRPFTGKHYDLSRKICHYWTNFAKHSNPNGHDDDGSPLPEWQTYKSDCPSDIFFGDQIETFSHHEPESLRLLKETHKKVQPSTGVFF